MYNSDIKVWAQMFFDDGSVSQGLRVRADIYDDAEMMKEIANKLLKSVNRDEGLLLIWGAGLIYNRHCYPITSSSQAEASDS